MQGFMKFNTPVQWHLWSDSYKSPFEWSGFPWAACKVSASLKHQFCRRLSFVCLFALAVILDHRSYHSNISFPLLMEIPEEAGCQMTHRRTTTWSSVAPVFISTWLISGLSGTYVMWVLEVLILRKCDADIIFVRWTAAVVCKWCYCKCYTFVNIHCTILKFYMYIA